MNYAGSTRCAHCGHREEATHWNPPGQLAPVESELLIKLTDDIVVRAVRTAYLQDREGDMRYRIIGSNHSVIRGKYEWTHP